MTGSGSSVVLLWGNQKSTLDVFYIRQWTEQHGTRDLLEKLLKESA